MAQQVQAKQPKVILRTQHAHLDAAEIPLTRAAVQFFKAAIIQLMKSSMQVYRPWGYASAQGNPRSPMLLRPHVEVNISVRTQTLLGVKLSRRPAFGEERFHSRRAKHSERLLNLGFMDGCLEDVEAVALLELDRGRTALKFGVTHSPPAQGRGS